MKKIIFIFLCLLPTSSLATESAEEGTFAFGDLLIWQIREGSADNWAQNIAHPGNYRPATIIDAPFNWNAGFRVGIGYVTCNQWDTSLSWTRYQTKAVNNAAGNIYSAFLGNFFANNTNGVNFGPFYNQADIEWEFLFNTIDLELGHSVEIDPVLMLRPFIGLKGAFINQDINTNWYGPNTTFLGIPIPITTFSSATETLRQDFSGIGPSVGVDTTWTLDQDSASAFNLVGDISGALLLGHWRFSDLYQNNTPTSINVDLSDINGAAPMIRGFLGVEWDFNLADTDMKVRVGYEAQVWFNQMQYYSLNMGRLNNLMALQGGTLDFCINF